MIYHFLSPRLGPSWGIGAPDPWTTWTLVSTPEISSV